jgi:hypothetical protein
VNGYSNNINQNQTFKKLFYLRITRNGTFSIHNYHVWADENPHTIHVNAFQHRFSIKLWTGILGDSLASVDKQTIIR